jgi:hypothetical protein
VISTRLGSGHSEFKPVTVDPCNDFRAFSERFKTLSDLKKRREIIDNPHHDTSRRSGYCIEFAQMIERYDTPPRLCKLSGLLYPERLDVIEPYDHCRLFRHDVHPKRFFDTASSSSFCATFYLLFFNGLKELQNSRIADTGDAQTRLEKHRDRLPVKSRAAGGSALDLNAWHWAPSARQTSRLGSTRLRNPIAWQA